MKKTLIGQLARDALSYKAYLREKKAVSAGIRKYTFREKNKLYIQSRLRRNIHRVEKGLIMQPRRAVFGESYINETVLDFDQCLYEGSEHDDEIKWCASVLSRYFFEVEHSAVISNAYEIFIKILDRKGLDRKEICNRISFMPYEVSLRPSIAIKKEELNALFTRRRSVRWFLDEPISTQILQQAVVLASQAPTACNRQPYHYKLVTNREQINRIASLAGGASGFAHGIPCLAVVVGDLSSYFNDRDRHLIYIDSALSASYFVLSLEVLGLASCIINWPDVEYKDVKIQQELGLEDYQKVTMLIAIGKPDAKSKVPSSIKKDVSGVLVFVGK